MVEQISPRELHEKLQKNEKVIIIDVRNQNELDICKIENSMHIPLHELGQRYHQLPDDISLVVQCHHGGRSQRAAEYLIQQGFRDVYNLAGGIELWAAQIDPTMARY